PPGTSLTETDQTLDGVEKIIMSLPDVAHYSRRTGTQLGFFVTEPNTGDYVIQLKPRRQRRAIDEVIDDLRTKIAAAHPSVHTDFGQLLEDNIGGLSGGVPQPIDVKIYGDNQALLQEKARAAAQILRGVSGVEDVFDGITVAGPKLVIAANAESLARYGLTTETLHEQVEPALSGTVAGQLRIGERLHDIRGFTPSTTHPVALHRRPIQPPSASLVPLSRRASVSTGKREVEIHRENLRTYIGATARLSGRSLGSAMAEIRSRLAKSLALPAGMSLEFGGLY